MYFETLNFPFSACYYYHKYHTQKEIHNPAISFQGESVIVLCFPRDDDFITELESTQVIFRVKISSSGVWAVFGVMGWQYNAGLGLIVIVVFIWVVSAEITQVIVSQLLPFLTSDWIFFFHNGFFF